MFADLLEQQAYRTLPTCHTIAAWLLRGEVLLSLPEEEEEEGMREADQP